MNKKKNDKNDARRPRRNPYVRVEGAALFRLDDGTRLDWVPGYEPHLLFATDIFDKEKDPMLRVYRVIRRNGRQYRCQLDNMLERFRGRDKLRCRLRYGTHINGKMIRLLRSQLTVLCLTGFPIADRRHWVIDHKNGITLDDRPSNLQVINQKENLARSWRIRETLALSNKDRAKAAARRIERMEFLRRQYVAIHPDADPFDIEFELALQLNEEEEREHELKIRAQAKKEETSNI